MPPADGWIDWTFLRNVSRHVVSSCAVYLGFWAPSELLALLASQRWHWITRVLDHVEQFVLAVVVIHLARQLLKELIVLPARKRALSPPPDGSNPQGKIDS